LIGRSKGERAEPSTGGFHRRKPSPRQSKAPRGQLKGIGDLGRDVTLEAGWGTIGLRSTKLIDQTERDGTAGGTLQARRPPICKWSRVGDRKSLRLKRSQPHGPRDSEWQQRYERLARSLRKRQERCLSRRIITEGRVMGGGTGPEGKLPATAGEGGWQDDPPDRGDQRERGGGA
jgi:hypothetical protein